MGEDGWRVSIHGADRGNPFALLGFVTRVGGDGSAAGGAAAGAGEAAGDGGERFEVCVIGRPGDAIVAPTLEAAVEVLRPRPSEVEGILAGIRH